MRAVRRWVGVLAIGVLAIATACRRQAAPTPEPPVDAAPVPAPDGLVAELSMATPNGLWSRVQRGVGGMVGILPPTFGGLLCSLAGLDVALAPAVDGTAPAFAAVTLDEGRWSFVLAARLVDGTRAGPLVSGDTSRFEARDAGAITLLLPKGAGSPDVALGLATSGPHAYLLVADTQEALTRVGPYAYRTLPARAQSAGPGGIVARAPRAAFAGPLSEEARRLWANARAEALRNDADLRQRHGGRAPDFGDAPVILDAVDAIVTRALAVAADLDSASFVLDADAVALHGQLSLTPASDSGAAAQALQRMAVGDAAPLAAVPPNVLLGVMTRSGAEGRSEDGAALTSSLEAALGPRLRPEDTRKVHAAIDDWERVRGDWLTAAVALEGGFRLTVRTPTSDAAKAARAVRELLELATLPAFAGPLRSIFSVTGLTLGPDAPGLGTALDRPGVATLRREGLAKGSKAGAAWAVDGVDLIVALAEDPVALLAGAAATPGRPESDVRTYGNDTGFALFANPFPSSSASVRAPLTLGWGRNEQGGWARADVPYPLVRELVRRQLGL